MTPCFTDDKAGKKLPSCIQVNMAFYNTNRPEMSNKYEVAIHLYPVGCP